MCHMSCHLSLLDLISLCHAQAFETWHSQQLPSYAHAQYAGNNAIKTATKLLVIHHPTLGAGLRTNMMKVSSGVMPDPSLRAGFIILFRFYFITYGPSSVKLINSTAVTLAGTLYKNMVTQTTHDVGDVAVK
jgi:hypothetical protein